MKYQIQQSFYNFKKNGDAVLQPVGKYLSTKEFAALTSAKKAKCVPVGKNPNLTIDQAYELVTAYCEGISADEIVSEFLFTHPEFSAAQGVHCQLRIIAGRDNTNPQDGGLDNPGAALESAMMSVDSVRFGVDIDAKLDALLATIWTFTKLPWLILPDETEHVFDVVNLAVVKLMALVELRHKIVLNVRVLK